MLRGHYSNVVSECGRPLHLSHLHRFGIIPFGWCSPRYRIIPLRFLPECSEKWMILPLELVPRRQIYLVPTLSQFVLFSYLIVHFPRLCSLLPECKLKHDSRPRSSLVWRLRGPSQTNPVFPKYLWRLWRAVCTETGVGRPARAQIEDHLSDFELGILNEDSDQPIVVEQNGRG